MKNSKFNKLFNVVMESLSNNSINTNINYSDENQLINYIENLTANLQIEKFATDVCLNLKKLPITEQNTILKRIENTFRVAAQEQASKAQDIQDNYQSDDDYEDDEFDDDTDFDAVIDDCIRFIEKTVIFLNILYKSFPQIFGPFKNTKVTISTFYQNI